MTSHVPSISAGGDVSKKRFIPEDFQIGPDHSNQIKVFHGYDTLSTKEPPTSQGRDIIENLTAIKIGTDNGERIGRQINVMSISLRIMQTPFGKSEANQQKQWVFRVILLVDTQNNKSLQLDINDFLTPIPNSAGGVGGSNVRTDVLRFRKFETFSRYIVAYDRYHVNNPGGTDDNPGQIINFSKNTDITIDYDGDTFSNAPTNLTKNCLKLLIIAEGGLAFNTNGYGSGLFDVFWKVTYQG